MNIYNIILVGYTAGKTNFLLRCVGEDFRHNHLTTIGYEFKIKEMQLEDGNTVKLCIWDTAGQERFYTLISHDFQKYDGIILIYDVTEKESFDFVKDLYKRYKGRINEKSPIFLVGNKIDEEEHRQISTEEGILYAKKHGFIFYECSAKLNINIDSIINAIFKKINDNKFYFFLFFIILRL